MGAKSKTRSARPGKPEPTVVGIGTSAGGLAALRTFFEHVPEDSGLAFVVIVHLSPGAGHRPDDAKSAEAGFDRHLVKPVDLPDLYELIAELRAAAGGRGAAALAEG
jgi:hypothetical protein